MEFKASLNNVRVSPRKMRTVANLIKGLGAEKAQAQLNSFAKKDAVLILKLLNSALANVKHNFSGEIKTGNLFVSKIVVENGPMLKRWLPRAMGRATPLMKRTCSVKITLAERLATAKSIKTKKNRPEVIKERDLPGEPIHEKKAEVSERAEDNKSMLPERPYGASGRAKKRFFSRQTAGNVKKTFRRKSI